MRATASFIFGMFWMACALSYYEYSTNLLAFLALLIIALAFFLATYLQSPIHRMRYEKAWKKRTGKRQPTVQEKFAWRHAKKRAVKQRQIRRQKEPARWLLRREGGIIVPKHTKIKV